MFKAGPKRTGVLLLPLLFVMGGIWLEDRRADGTLPIWSWWFVGFIGLCAGVAAAFVLYPPRLVLDAEGLVYTQLGWRKRVRWADLESAGAAIPPSTIGRRSITTAKRPMIGLKFRPERNPVGNPATAAYKRGFTGYDVNIPNWFDSSTDDIVALLNERIATHAI